MLLFIFHRIDPGAKLPIERGELARLFPIGECLFAHHFAFDALEIDLGAELLDLIDEKRLLAVIA